MKTALLLIDLQNDFLSAQNLEPAAGIVVENAHRVLDCARKASIPIVHIWTTVNAKNQLSDTRMPHWKNAEKWSCVEGTKGQQTPRMLAPIGAEAIVHKQFFSGFESGALNEILQARHIDTVILAGVHTHGCIRATALDAYARGFRVLVARDGIGSDDALHAAITLRYLDARSMTFLSTPALFSLLQNGQDSVQALSVQAPQLNAALIGGDVVDGRGLEKYLHLSPRDGSQMWGAPLCNSSIVACATQSAQLAQRQWRVSSISERVVLLKRFAFILQGETENLARQMALEIGKPVLQGRSEIARAVALIETVVSYENEALERRCTPDSIARFRSLGTVAVVTPWNNPVAIPVGKIAPALFYGNGVVWKPSPPASAIAFKVLNLLRRAGCPNGLVNLLCGDHATASLLMQNENIDAVTFTGAVASGYAAQEICARRHIPLQAELGGNNAAIVWRDCDLKSAARKIAEAAFGFAGQRCTANRRVVVETSVYDAFLQHLETATRALVWGEPCNEGTQIGPLISRHAQRQSSTRIERARLVASKIVTPHENQANREQLVERGTYFPPTIVCCDDASAEIVQEESFAPILVVQRATDFEHAISLCNGVRQGLAAALFSENAQLQQRFLEEAQAGILKIGNATADANAQAPFGGWKSSGIGAPEHGFSNREFWTRVQTVYKA